jgi:hypothetical protein
MGQFWLYAITVSVYYLVCMDLDFDQTPLASKIHRLQTLMFFAMIALIIASGSLSSTSWPPNSQTEQLRQAYSILFMVGTLLITALYARLWYQRRPTEETVFIWTNFALAIVILKGIYIVASAFDTDISPYNFFISTGWYVGANLAPDFIASMLVAIGGVLGKKPKSKPPGRRHGRMGTRLRALGNAVQGKPSVDTYQSDLEYRQ